MPTSRATASPATRYMVSIQIAGASWERQPGTRGRRREPSLVVASAVYPLSHRLLLMRRDRVLRTSKFDSRRYIAGQGLTVTVIRPRPIVAAAIAVHTASRGAPLGTFRNVFSA